LQTNLRSVARDQAKSVMFTFAVHENTESMLDTVEVKIRWTWRLRFI